MIFKMLDGDLVKWSLTCILMALVMNTKRKCVGFAKFKQNIFKTLLFKLIMVKGVKCCDLSLSCIKIFSSENN